MNMNQAPADYTLYGVELSLYTGKARAYLRYKGVNWTEVMPDKKAFFEVIMPTAGSPIIPVMKTNDGDLVQDSTEIIDFIEAKEPEFSVYPTGPKQKLAALLLEFFGDEWLLLPAMHFRWNYLDQQHDFIMSEFGRQIKPNASVEEQIELGKKNSPMFRSSVPKMGITEDTIEGVESSYLTVLDQLNTHFTHHKYLLGSRPCIGDYGLHASLYAHLARDPYPKALMQKRAPEVYKWVERMNHPQEKSGEFLENDQVPETLLPILSIQSAEQLPDVLKVIAANEQFINSNPGKKIPRVLGYHEFTIGGKTGTRWINSYTQWMFQRPLFFYQHLSANHKTQADELLKAIQAYDAFQTNIEKPLARKKGQLELVEQAFGQPLGAYTNTQWQFGS